MRDVRTIPPILNDDPAEPCEFDCIYVDGACRCGHGEYSFGSDGLADDLVLPF
jgi:hypothetical protein